MKSEIYFNEYNFPTGDDHFLPAVSGGLSAHIMNIPHIAAHFTVKEIFFKRDCVQNILNGYKSPSIACFSAMMWNEQLCLTVARKVKEKWPHCLIIFGGAQVPLNAVIYLEDYPFIDIACRGEGEEQLATILESLINGDNLSGIGGLTYRDTQNKIYYNINEFPLKENLDIFPSPYLSGTFDKIIEQNPNFQFKVILETNSGKASMFDFVNELENIASKTSCLKWEDMESTSPTSSLITSIKRPPLRSWQETLKEYYKEHLQNHA